MPSIPRDHSRPDNPLLERIGRALHLALENNLVEDAPTITRLRDAMLVRRKLAETRVKEPKLYEMAMRGEGDRMERLQKEALQRDANTALFSTTAAAFIEHGIRPYLLGANIIKHFRVDNVMGSGTIKIPKSVDYTAATELGDDAAFTNQTSVDYIATEIIMGTLYKSQLVTRELINHSIVPLFKEIAFETGNSIARGIDVKILAALLTATPANDANANYDSVGGAVDISWGAIETYESEMIGNEMQPDIVLTGTANGKILRETMSGNESYFRMEGSLMRQVPVHFGKSFIIHPSVAANTTYLIDSKWLGYFIHKDAEFFIYPLSGVASFEAWTEKTNGCKITENKALHRIMDNT